MSARAFVWRWSWRLVRKDWRQYVVILAMLTIAIAAAVSGVLIAHNMSAPNEIEYGNGQIEAQSRTPDALEQAMKERGVDYGAIRRTTVQRDGQVGDLRLVAADPANTITEPLFTLLEGRWPSNDQEVAVTDLALSDRAPVGTSIQLDGRTVEIVGMVENPTRLSEEFVFAATPTVFESANTADNTRFLVDASEDGLSEAFPGDLGITSTSGPTNRTAVAILVNVIVAFGMLEVALLVGSGFAVIARRRTRQYGLLAATGAAPSTVRSAAAASGAIIGLIGTVAGLVVGLLVARGLVGAMETSVDHRINFGYPLLALLPSVMLGVGVTTLAARQPAAALKRRSVASLLGAARPKPQPVGRSAVLGVVLAVLGTVLLVTGFKSQEITFALFGTILTPVGLLLLAPLLVRLVGKVASRLPLAERLAGRSIGRYNRRSASMVAALALALSIPVAIAVVTGSIDQRAENRPPNLADNQLIVWAPDVNPDRHVIPASLDQDQLAIAAEALADAAPDLSVIPLQVMILAPEDGYTERGVTYDFAVATGKENTGEEECNFCGVDVSSFGDGVDYVTTMAFIATPELLDTFDLETTWLTDGKLALAAEPGMAAVEPTVLATGDSVAVSTSWPNIGSFPKLLYSAKIGGGAQPTTVGWLATSTGQLDDATLAAIGQADLSGAKLELPTPPASRSSLRTIGLAVGMLVGLGITAAALVLLTGELARDSALLASLGASPRTGRRTSAVIAALLAIVGAALAVVIGYVPLAPMISSRVDGFPFVVPWTTLVTLLLGLPVIAAGFGWFFSKKAATGLNLRDFA